MACWFTSDTHFGHRNIIAFSNRPYRSVEEMDLSLIANWNKLVKPSDTVYHLGDFMWYKKEIQQRQILEQLNGNIKVVLGNHDDDLYIIPNKMTVLPAITTLKFFEAEFKLCHYPLLEWDGAFRGTICLHGHSHNLWPQTPYRRLDIGVDGHKMTPWSLPELIEWANNRPIFDQKVFRTTAP